MKLAHKLMPFVFVMQGVGAHLAFKQDLWIPTIAFLITGGVSFLIMLGGSKNAQ